MNHALRATRAGSVGAACKARWRSGQAGCAAGTRGCGLMPRAAREARRSD